MKSKISIYSKIKADRRKNRFYRLYTSKKGCFDCGIKGPIEIYEFDHIDGSTKKSRIKETGHVSASISWSFRVNSLKKLFKEIRRTQVVCANCHSIRTFKRKSYFNK